MPKVIIWIKNLQKKFVKWKKGKSVEGKFGNRVQKNNNVNPFPGTVKKKSTSTQKKGNANKIKEEVLLQEPKPLSAVQKIQENNFDQDNKGDEEKMLEIPIEETNKYNFKLYKNLKENW